MNKLCTIFTVLVGCYVLQAKNLYTKSFGGFPVDLNYKGDVSIFEYMHYAVGYDETRKNPVWVAYFIPEKVKYNNLGRHSTFKSDPRSISQVKHDDYTHTKYNRGHMAPNYAFASRFGKESQLETYFTTNIAPQHASLNQKVLNKLESIIANKIAANNGGCHVITGSYFDEEIEILNKEIEIPDGFYKIVIYKKERTGAWMSKASYIEQKNGDPTQKYEHSDVKSVTIDFLENLTGLDFFTELEDSFEEKLESSKASRVGK